MKKNLPNLSTYAKFLRYGDRIRPYRDWVVIVSAAAVLFIGSCVWSYLLFRQVSLGSNLTGSPDTASLVNTASIEAVQAMFEARAVEQARYRSDYRFIDPSK